MEGSLSGFSLQEVLEMLAAKEKTGALTIDAQAAGQGCMWLKDGRLCRAEASTVERYAADDGGPEGAKEATEEAVLDILNWGDGIYAFKAGEEADVVDEIMLDVATVLADAAKLQEEWARIRKEIPSLKARVELIAAIEGKDVTLTKNEWSIVALIGRSATVEDVREELKTSPLAVSRALFDMSKKGLIRCLGEAIESTPATGRMESVPPAPSKKYIRRSLLADEEADGLVPAEWASYYQLLDSRKVAARPPRAAMAEH